MLILETIKAGVGLDGFFCLDVVDGLPLAVQKAIRSVQVRKVQMYACRSASEVQ